MSARNYGQTTTPINNESLVRNRKDITVTREEKGPREGYKTMNLPRVTGRDGCAACIIPHLLRNEVYEVCY